MAFLNDLPIRCHLPCFIDSLWYAHRHQLNGQMLPSCLNCSFWFEDFSYCCQEQQLDGLLNFHHYALCFTNADIDSMKIRVSFDAFPKVDVVWQDDRSELLCFHYFSYCVMLLYWVLYALLLEPFPHGQKLLAIILVLQSLIFQSKVFKVILIDFN